MIDWIRITQNNFDFILDATSLKNHNYNSLDSALFTIEHICKNYSPPYTLLASGGVDSQAMIYAWLRSGKEFKIRSAIYNSTFNLHDLETLDLFSKKFNFDVEYINFDLLSFLDGEYENYVNKYRCGSPHICTYMRLIDEVKEGTTILSGNFIDSKARSNCIDRNNFGLYKFGLWSGKSVVPYFFIETEELAYSFSDDDAFNKSGYERKVALYQINQYPVIPQQKKFTGFEKVKDYCDLHFANRVTIQDKLIRQPNGAHSKRVFDLLYRNKHENRYSSDIYSLRF